MQILKTKEQVKAQCKHLGVRFYHHGEPGSGTNIGAWGNLVHGSEFTKQTLITLCPRILLPTTVKDPFEIWRTIRHELVHWLQQDDSFLWWWVIRYGTSKDFRYRMEREALLVDMVTGYLGLDEIVWRLQDPGGIYRITNIPEASMYEWFTENAKKLRDSQG